MEVFAGHAVIELFGHRQIAGFVSETEIAGKRMVHVLVPCRAGTEATREADGWPEEKIFGPDAIYALTPCSEAFARKIAEGLQPQRYNALQLEASSQDVDRYDVDDDQDEEEEDDPDEDNQG